MKAVPPSVVRNPSRGKFASRFCTNLVIISAWMKRTLRKWDTSERAKRSKSVRGASTRSCLRRCSLLGDQFNEALAALFIVGELVPTGATGAEQEDVTSAHATNCLVHGGLERFAVAREAGGGGGQRPTGCSDRV